ncbi:uncharacterized protein LOC143527328 [Brachyhypopomus gauderio]|uniref:uncharacterized protein LOC143527328 n=1 Tax=Brachyhypopomus gauderio TaxID=698409 RepID=UPI004040F71D
MSAISIGWKRKQTLSVPRACALSQQVLPSCRVLHHSQKQEGGPHREQQASPELSTSMASPPLCSRPSSFKRSLQKQQQPHSGGADSIKLLHLAQALPYRLFHVSPLDVTVAPGLAEASLSQCPKEATLGCV